MFTTQNVVTISDGCGIYQRRLIRTLCATDVWSPPLAIGVGVPLEVHFPWLWHSTVSFA